jgi:hypothetical protein
MTNKNVCDNHVAEIRLAPLTSAKSFVKSSASVVARQSVQLVHPLL